MKKILGISLSFLMVSMGVYFLNAGFDANLKATNDTVLTLDAWNQLVGNVTYSTSETDTGKKWIDGKTIYRKVIDFGALPNAGDKNVSHGISNIDFLVSYQATSKHTGGTFLNFPAIDNNVKVWSDGTNVNVRTYTDLRTYTITYIILEYTKN